MDTGPFAGGRQRFASASCRSPASPQLGCRLRQLPWHQWPPGMESLAGVSQEDIVKKMQDYKTGRRPATLMHQISKGYSDDQIQAIAAYFAAQKK
jgi:hypothetical protein